ncbi:rhamnulokinase [Microbacterium sp. AK009]|nr:rhamnulokinase [Microbacterium sp. AK009]
MPLTLPSGLHWDIGRLFSEIGGALRDVGSREGNLISVGVDSWGADYGLFHRGRLLGLPFTYRDPRALRGLEATHRRIDAATLYRHNGLEPLPFNSLYQLSEDDEQGVLDLADLFLPIPDLMGYWLTSVASTEPTIASTTGLLNAATQTWDPAVMNRAGIPGRILPPLQKTGDSLARVSPQVQSAFGLPATTRVIKVASHDTAAAAVAAPLDERNSAYLSCGTWALIGVEISEPITSDAARSAGFTNEAGLDGRTLLQKNLMGLGLINDLVKENPDKELAPLLEQAASVVLRPDQLIDPSDPLFLRPGRASLAIIEWFARRERPVPAGYPALIRCVLESLAQAFAEAIRHLEVISERSIPAIHIVGGGAQNTLLCQATADRSGKTVIAGPVEASVIGNVLIQARSLGMIDGDNEDLRNVVRASFRRQRFRPR